LGADAQPVDHPSNATLDYKTHAELMAAFAKRDTAYLRMMDRHMLKDMGIDISALVETYPSLERSPNNVKCETSGFFRLPVNMSTR
jgi:hypothetical protein